MDAFNAISNAMDAQSEKWLENGIDRYEFHAKPSTTKRICMWKYQTYKHLTLVFQQSKGIKRRKTSSNTNFCLSLVDFRFCF